jgi:RNA polymerase sigma-70 factor (ECF subfamily)
MKYNTEQIWSAFSGKIRKFINQRISNSSNSDDILQEIFIKIHSNIDTLKDEVKIQSWIYRIAQNTIVDYYRKQKKGAINIDNVQIGDEQDDEDRFMKNYLKYKAVDFSNKDNSEDVEQEIASGLKDMVKALPEKYSSALLFVEFEGISQIELAAKLGISISGAKSRVQRGRKMLRDALMKCCHFEFDKYGTIISAHPILCCCCNN